MTDPRATSYAALLLRLTLGVAFLAHGLLKVFVFTIPGTVGFFDDYFKLKKKNSGGLSGRLRLLLEFALTGLVFGYLFLSETKERNRSIEIFYWQVHKYSCFQFGRVYGERI